MFFPAAWALPARASRLLGKGCVQPEGRRPAQRRATRWEHRSTTAFSGPSLPTRPYISAARSALVGLAARESGRWVHPLAHPNVLGSLPKGEEGNFASFFMMGMMTPIMIIISTSLAIPCPSPAHPPAPTPGHQTRTRTQTHRRGPLSPRRSPSRHRSQRLLARLETTRATGPSTRPDGAPSPALHRRGPSRDSYFESSWLAGGTS